MSDVPPSWDLLHAARDWQIEALHAWRNANRRGIAQVVTGGGKTVFAEMCILDFYREYPNARVIIVVPTLTLLDQWYVSLNEELDVDDEDIATYSGEGRPCWPRRINLMVINTAREAAPAVAHHDHVLLIVDECHRAGSPENAKALAGTHTATLGLSATPHREYDDGLHQFLIPSLGSVLFNYGYNQAVRDGVVTPFDLTNVAIDLLPDEAAEYENLTRRIARALHVSEVGREENPRVRRLLQQRAGVAAGASLRIPTAVRIATEHPRERILIFHERIAAADVIYQLLKAKGSSVALYHSRLGPAIRRDNLRLFRQGVFEVLVTCRALDEGMNVPETSIAIIASATASARQRIQRMGRVLRPAKGKERATIYTIYATPNEEQRLARESRDLVEARSVSWQRVKIDG